MASVTLPELDEISHRKRRRGQLQVHISRPGADAPHALGHAFAVNVAAARLGMKAAIDAAYRDVAGPGADIHLAALFLQDRYAAARLIFADRKLVPRTFPDPSGNAFRRRAVPVSSRPTRFPDRYCLQPSMSDRAAGMERSAVFSGR